MVTSQFFLKQGPFPLKDITKTINCTCNLSDISNFEINGLQNLIEAKENDLSFLNSSKYKDISKKTKALACITSPNLSKFLPD